MQVLIYLERTMRNCQLESRPTEESRWRVYITSSFNGACVWRLSQRRDQDYKHMCTVLDFIFTREAILVSAEVSAE